MYVDDELPSTERGDIVRHLRQCPPCRETAEREQAGRTMIREGAARLPVEPLPPGLRARCDALARAHAAGPSGAPLPRLVPALVAAVLVVFTVGALLALLTRASDTLLAAQLVADHAKCFASLEGEDREADAAQIERMLASRFGWNIHVPPSSARDGVRLVGARRCLYAEGRVPHLMYRAGDQEVSLYVLQGMMRRSADLVTFGHHSRIWSRGDSTFVLVSHDGRPLERIAGYFMQAAR